MTSAALTRGEAAFYSFLVCILIGPLIGGATFLVPWLLGGAASGPDSVASVLMGVTTAAYILGLVPALVGGLMVVLHGMKAGKVPLWAAILYGLLGAPVSLLLFALLVGQQPAALLVLGLAHVTGWWFILAHAVAACLCWLLFRRFWLNLKT